MMRVYVNITDLGARAGISRLRSRLENAVGIHEAIAEGVGEQTREHVRGLRTRSPNTNFYGRAAESLETNANDAEAIISIPQRGFRLRYYGGRVRPVREGIKNLAIPTENVPVTNFVRLSPRDVGPLAFIPRLNGPSITTGYLVEGVEKTITRGANKGRKRIVPKVGGKLMYVLRGFTDHEPDEAIIPTEEKLVEGARTAVRDYLG